MFGWREALLLIAVLAAGFAAIGYQVKAAHASGTFAFQNATSSVQEGDIVCINIVRTVDVSQPSIVTVEFTGASLADIAAGGTTAVANVNFAANDSQRAIRFNTDVTCIQTVENGDNQANRTIGLEITAVTSGGIGAQSTHTLTVLDDDGPAQYSYQSSSVNVVEGTQNFAVTVTRSGATGAASSVDCIATGGTAVSPADFSLDDDDADFDPGDTTDTCTVDIGANAGGKTIILGFTNPSGFPGGVGSNATVTINITEQPTGTVQFTSNSFSVTEGGLASVTVSRTGGTSGSASVTCATTGGGTATAGVDYTAMSTTLNWNDGDGANKTCQVQTTNDANAENNETVILQLTNASGVTIGAQSTTTLTIIDNDGAGTIQFTSASYSGTESGGAITITVSRTGDTTGQVSVDYATSNGSAIAGSDYTATNGTLTWLNGESGNRTFTVTPLVDATNEGPETVNLILSNVTGGATLGSPNTAVLTINDSTLLPTISSVTPAAGPLSGGTAITITGTNFVGTPTVSIGGVACTNVVLVNSTTITCNVPARATAATVDVVVTTTNGSSATTGTANDFTYTSGPIVTAISPNTGPASGVTTVTITGSNFTASGLVVRFGTVQATATFIDANTIIAVAPAQSAGVVDVTVQTPGGTSPNTAADDFTYTGVSVPVVTSLAPTSGPVGTSVVITGTGFTGATSVTFGGVAATYTVNSPTQITATVPAGTPGGSVDVRVTGPGGQSANTANDNFNNTSNPTITYTLYFRFTLIVWTGADNKPISTALAGGTAGTNNVASLIGAIWLFNPQTQQWLGYFPGSEGVPGANDFTTFRTNQAYFIALKSATGAPITWTTSAN